MIPSPADAKPLPPLLGKPRELAAGAGVLLIATLIVFGNLLFDDGDRILSYPNTDIFTVFVGWCEFTFGEMARGNLPLWNPHLFSGAPCLAGFQEALLYPPSWLHLVLPLPQAINYGIALHVFLAGLFTYLWMTRRGLHPVSAILAGLIFMFGGGYFLHISAGHLPNLRTMVWAPLIFLAIDDLTTTCSLRGAWLGAGAVMMQILAGHPQYVYYTAMVAGPYALLGLWRAPSRRRALLGLALIAVGGAALSAIQLLPGLQAARESMRSRLDIGMARTFPFPPENLLTLVFPGFFGTLDDHSYWGRWFLWEDSLFVGSAALILAIYGIVRGEPRHRRFAAVFLLACLLVAFGYYTPLYGFLYRFLPGFSSFRGVSKVAFLAALFLANLAAVGFDRLLRSSQLSGAPGWAAGASAAVLLLIALILWQSGNSGSDGMWRRILGRIDWSNEAFGRGPTESRLPSEQFYVNSANVAAANMVRCAVACANFAILWIAAARRRRWAYGIAALAAAELIVFAFQNKPTFNLSTVSNMENQYAGMMQMAGPDGRVATDQPCFILGAGGDEAWGNDPMVLRRYAEFMSVDLPVGPEELVVRGGLTFNQKFGPTWGMVRLRAVLKPVNGGMMPTAVPGIQLSRAQLIESVRVVGDRRQMLDALAAPGFDPRRQVLLEAPISLILAGSAPGAQSAPGTVELKDLSSDAIDVTATVTRPCILLITDNYSPGWRALSHDAASSEKYEVIPADYTLRGIPLAPGKHHFTLQYLPTGYLVGKWVTLVSLIGYIAAGVLLWRPFRNRAAVAPTSSGTPSDQGSAPESSRARGRRR